MVNVEQMIDVFEKTIRRNEGLELLMFAERSLFVRYARSVIHQNALFDDTVINLGLRRGEKLASTAFTSSNIDKLNQEIEKLKDLLELMPSIKGLPPTVEPYPFEPVETKIEEIKPEVEFERVKRIIDAAENTQVHGILKKGYSVILYTNGRGLKLLHVSPVKYMKVIFEKGNRLVRKDYFDTDIEPENVIDDLRWRIEAGDEEVLIDPGRYTVILEPSALADLVEMMGYVSLNAKAVLECRSFFEDGKKVFNDAITIVDDHRFPDGFSLPFDFEGMPRKRVVMIEKGVCRNVVSDRLMGRRMNKESTGHSLGFLNPGFSFPMHMVFDAGDSSIDDMVKETDKGLFISNFHYINVINPRDLTLTGMTRFGTYLIEDGIITKPVRNLRFTQSVVEAFNNVVAVTKKREIIGPTDTYSYTIPCHMVVPGIKIEGFNFTGRTE